MSAGLSVFKLSVQTMSVCQLQQHRIEVSFEMAGLPYPRTPVASIPKQSSARQCRSVLAYMASQYRTSHDNPMDWDMAT